MTQDNHRLLPKDRPSYRPDIDGLRAIAVLGVMFYHLDLGMFPGGFSGVDVFFVISGYLISNLITGELDRTGSCNLVDFYLRRIRRLLPAFLVTLVLTILASIFLFSAEHLQRLGGSLVHAVFSLSNFFFWIEADYFDSESYVKPLLHTWSLSVEEQFYLLWPAMLIGIYRVGLARAVPLVILIVTSGSLYANHAFVDGELAGLENVSIFLADLITDGRSTIFYLLPFRIYELMLGAGMVYLVRYRIEAAYVDDLLVLLGAGFILAAYLLHSESLAYPYYNALLPCAGACLIIYAGGKARYLNVLLTNRFMVGIGLISYSLYLVHWPIIVLFRYYSFRPISLWQAMLIIAASIVLAGLLYRFVETPFRKIEPGKKHWAMGSGLAALAIIGLTVVAAANMWKNDGWDWRIPDTGGKKLPVVAEIRRTFIDKLHRVNKWTAAYRIGSGREDATRVLVAGDSHAGQFKQMAAYLGRKYNLLFDFYTFQGCPPLFGTYKKYSYRNQNLGKRILALCRQHTRKLEDFLRESSYGYVIVSSRWNRVLEDSNYFGTDQRRDLLKAWDDQAEDTVDDSRSVFKRQLNYTVETIKQTGAIPIVLGQVPNTGLDLSGCNDVPNYLFSHDDLEARCNYVPASEVLKRSKFSNTTIVEVAARHDALAVLGTELFCDEGRFYCRTLYGNTRLMDDESHLSPAGAVYFARRWEKRKDFPFRRP